MRNENEVEAQRAEALRERAHRVRVAESLRELAEYYANGDRRFPKSYEARKTSAQWLVRELVHDWVR